MVTMQTFGSISIREEDIPADTPFPHESRILKFINEELCRFGLKIENQVTKGQWWILHECIPQDEQVNFALFCVKFMIVWQECIPPPGKLMYLQKDELEGIYELYQETYDNDFKTADSWTICKVVPKVIIFILIFYLLYIDFTIKYVMAPWNTKRKKKLISSEQNVFRTEDFLNCFSDKVWDYDIDVIYAAEHYDWLCIVVCLTNAEVEPFAYFLIKHIILQLIVYNQKFILTKDNITSALISFKALN